LRNVPTRTRILVKGRADNRCERCSQYKPLEMSHRIARGMGGSKVGQDNPALYNALCHACHAWVEANPLLAHAGGWKVDRGADVCTVPCHAFYGWVLLDRQGGARTYNGETA